MSAQTSGVEPRPEPLFVLDLKENGGLFAPSSLEEIHNWINQEINFWSWVVGTQVGGNHDQGLRQALSQLDLARSAAGQASQFRELDPNHYRHEVAQSSERLRAAFFQCQLPHSTTPTAKRIELYRQAAGDHAASFFAAVFVPPPNGHHFQPQLLMAWRGMVEGVIERWGLLDSSPEARRASSEEVFEELRVRAQGMLDEKTLAYDKLHREYSELAASIEAADRQQKAGYDDAQTERQSDFEAQLAAHKKEMESLRRTFREDLSMKAPVTYWEAKRSQHVFFGWITGFVSFTGLVAAAIGMAWLVHDTLRSTVPNGAPETWRVGMVLIIGLFTIWALRLFVRMFLSHLHLATDAAERVVMTQTYLSLLEGDRLDSGEDRKLILQALFRPTSDGIVKDEGIPPSALEFLSRQPKP
ncbi:DUF6161 domain-containing protein [Ideonella alba]|uniref:DUF6161 domain-containing protein n=1 Tax=Ideonella alba TaxID=2824118 RepID=A0A940YBK5_9BURK|nr:DUF6161 domain-containing protein [Ideonella alba]MBQ0931178.1 hypothetical protein [Ideonella alba]